jgi:RNA-directed DNA polymerase
MASDQSAHSDTFDDGLDPHAANTAKGEKQRAWAAALPAELQAQLNRLTSGELEGLWVELSQELDRENPLVSASFISEIKELAAPFLKATNASSLAAVLNLALPLHTQRHRDAKASRVTVRTINYYAYKNQAARYRTFLIAKRARGETREIKAPVPGLQRIQRLLLLCMTAVFGQGHDSAHGFMPERSVLTNAQPHANRTFVLNLDLKDFFPATHIGRVVAVLQLPPFRFERQIAFLIANLCCDQGALPQGAPTSPLLTNVVCQRLDRRLRQLAGRFRCQYTRYADDLTFSSDRHVFGSNFHDALNAVLASEGYEQNLKKQRLQLPHMRQEVTGVVVNDFPNVPKEFLRQLRAMLHNWKTKGHAVASQTLVRKATHNLKRKDKRPSLNRVVAGKIAYVGMVRGRQDKLYLSLVDQYLKLDCGDYGDILEAVSIMETVASYEQRE